MTSKRAALLVLAAILVNLAVLFWRVVAADDLLGAALVGTVLGPTIARTIVLILWR